MDGHWLALFEGCLVFGAVIGLAGWELYSLRKDQRDKEVEREKHSSPSPVEPDDV